MRGALALLVVTIFGPAAAAAEPVSFRNEVMPILAKAGCNLGTCHGNARGKGGFQLSLRGQDAKGDFQVLTHDSLSRRVNVTEPDQSLLLLKATMQISHEGGRRFDADSSEYRTLRRWIEAGLPSDGHHTTRFARLTVEPSEIILTGTAGTAQLHTTAFDGAGNTVDVTQRAVYEVANPIVDVSPAGLVTPLGRGETTILVRFLDLQVPVRVYLLSEQRWEWNGSPPATPIDEHIFAKLRKIHVNPAPVVDDATFLRRVSLDLIGLLPTAAEARSFVADTSPGKRSRKIDELLERPEFADWWALRWADMLRVEEKTLDRKGVQAIHGWLREAFATGKPLDQMVAELIASRGSTYEVPEANFYRAMRDPFERSEGVAQLFLGVRLQCAKCHNHLFDRWTQNDYYAWSSLFAGVDYKILENNRKDTNDKHEFDGEQIVFINRQKTVNDPRTQAPRPAAFLSASGERPLPEEDPLLALSRWITSRDNDRFVEMMANRIWQQFVGRGIVEPVDDFRATNPPSNPELLQYLAHELRSENFNLKAMLRLIANSQTYQLSSDINPSNTDDEVNFSRNYVRRLPAEPLLDAISQALATPLRFNGYPVGLRAQQIPGVMGTNRRAGKPTEADAFLKLFGKPPRLQSCDCERSDEMTLNQTFELISGDIMNTMLARPENRLGMLLERNVSSAEVVSELCWTILSRPPSDQEQRQLTELLERSSDRRRTLEDLAWGLLTSHEFLLRR